MSAQDISTLREALSLAEAAKARADLDDARGHLGRVIALLKHLDKAEVGALPDQEDLKTRVKSLVEALKA